MAHFFMLPQPHLVSKIIVNALHVASSSPLSASLPLESYRLVALPHR